MTKTDARRSARRLANIKASYEHGVLTVTLPMVEKAKPRQIEVQVAAK